LFCKSTKIGKNKFKENFNILVKNEKDIFDVLNLEYKEPNERNF
jgi:DNA polymerase/3'-5' exonuclease PolX